MREMSTATADLRVPHLFRRWDLTEGDRFDWSLPPTWKSTEPRPAHVLGVRMIPSWRGDVDVVLEAHVIRKDGKAGVKGTDVRLDHSDIDDEQIPEWVRDERLALSRYLIALQDAAWGVAADFGLEVPTDA